MHQAPMQRHLQSPSRAINRLSYTSTPTNCNSNSLQIHPRTMSISGGAHTHYQELDTFLPCHGDQAYSDERSKEAHMVKLYRAQRCRQGRRVGRGEATCNPSVEDAPPIATVRQRRQRQPWSRRRGGLLRPLPLLGTSHRSHGREEIKKGTTRTRRLEV
jgi:hypothetical protein